MARASHVCNNCEETINPKEQYWAEYLAGGVRVLGLKLGKLCTDCYALKHEKLGAAHIVPPS